MSINRVDKDVARMHDGILSNHKKNKMTPLTATWMQLELIILSEASRRRTHHMMD